MLDIADRALSVAVLERQVGAWRHRQHRLDPGGGRSPDPDRDRLCLPLGSLGSIPSRFGVVVFVLPLFLLVLLPLLLLLLLFSSFFVFFFVFFLFGCL